ncbi:MAG: AAA family ATPase [Pirellulaceae bacterium]
MAPAMTSEPRSITSEQLVQFLQSPHAYAERVRTVECVETHISWVFLTERHAYKLKKPVKFEFLDFSTPALRRAACEQEVALNRRLAGEVYHGVTPITCERGRLTLDGKGEPIDWVVKMSRLPADRSLDRLITADTLSPARLDELSAKLVDFYVPLSSVMLSTSDYHAHLEQHVAANRQELLDKQHGLPSAIVKRIHAAQFRLLRLAPNLLADRVCDGRIVDGHGDLRPEHIYFTPSPVVIDCLEFSSELRQVDVLDDLAFLAIECELLGAGWIGDHILKRYRQQSGDHYPPALLDFYKSYRACVRAKVAALRVAQVEQDQREAVRAEALRHLELADRHAAAIGPPLVLVVHGLSGSGKSTLAERLAASLKIDRLSTDDIRREDNAARVREAAYGEGAYQAANRQRVYDEMLARADAAVRDGHSLILDGTFPTVGLRQRAIDLANERGAIPLLVRCECSTQVALERIDARRRAGGSASDATAEVHQRQLEQYEADAHGQPRCVVDTSDGINSEVEAVLECLRRRYDFFS